MCTSQHVIISPQISVCILQKDLGFSAGEVGVPVPAAGGPRDSDYASFWSGLSSLQRQQIQSPWFREKRGGTSPPQAVLQNSEKLLPRGR